MARTKHQAPSELLTCSDISDAEYNPRQITALGRRKLSEGLQRFKLVATLTVNRRRASKGWSPAEDGRLVMVGGHQRRKDLIKKHRGSQDFEIECTVVELDPAKERELNVLLNNPTPQGQFDLTLLEELFHFPDFDPDHAGVTPMQAEMFFGDTFADLFDSPEAQKAQKDAAEIAQAMKDRKAEYKAQNDTEIMQGDCYVVFYWAHEEDRNALLAKLGIPVAKHLDQRFQLGEVLSAALGLPVGRRLEPENGRETSDEL